MSQTDNWIQTKYLGENTGTEYLVESFMKQQFSWKYNKGPVNIYGNTGPGNEK